MVQAMMRRNQRYIWMGIAVVVVAVIIGQRAADPPRTFVLAALAGLAASFVPPLAGMLYGIVCWASGEPAAGRLVNGVRKQVDGWVDQANDSLERDAPKK